MTVTLSSAITIMIVMIVVNFIADGLYESIFRKDELWYKLTLRKAGRELLGIISFLLILYISTHL